MKPSSNANRNGIALTLLSLTLAIGVAHGARVEENNPAIAFNGAWASMADPQASGGAYMVSNIAGNTVTFQFTGDSLVLYRYLSTGGGQAGVTVDGNAWGMIFFNSPQQAEQIPAVLDHLGAGPHTIVLTVAAPFGGGAAGNVTIDAFEFPTTFAPNANQTAGIAAINQIRAQAGLPPASLSTALSLAAQAHADYLAGNAIGGHDEAPGMPGFVGAGPSDRAQYFGYDDAGSEVANPGGDTANAVNQVWMPTVYHRTPFLNFRLVDVGCGSRDIGQNGGGVVDFGSKRGAPAASRLMVPWPANNQTLVPLNFGVESPKPFPDTSNLGYPISLHIAQPANVTQGTDNIPASATLTGPNNQQIAINYLDRNNDTNKQGLQDDYFMVPQQPLTAGTTYTANITGTDTQGNQFNQTWSFTTEPAATVIGLGGYPVGLNYVFQWGTAGAVTATTMNLGLTAAYGMTVTPRAAGTNTYLATLMGLAGGTYHYQVTATDPAGATFTTPDATFTVASIPNAQASLDFAVPSASSVTFGWHTFGPVTSTQAQYGTTTAYGMTVAGQLQDPNNPLAFFAAQGGLTPSTTYHFQISATDAQGNTNSTSDMTFTTTAQ